MKPIAPSYTAASTTFDVFDDGKYPVKGINWFSLDADRPILVAQSDGKLVGRMNFILQDGNDGPPHSVTLGEMPLLVKAFGGDITKLPAKPDLSIPAQVSAYMEKIQELSVGKTSVEVKGGWVRSIAGAEVPTGLYYFRVIDVSPKNKETELPEPRDGQWGLWFLVDFEVVAGEGGSQTPWAGVRFTEFISYAVDVTNGEPDWSRTRKGDYTGAAVQLSHLMLYAAPSMFEEGFSFKNPNNILPDFLHVALKEQKVLKGFRQKNKKGDRVILDLATVEPANYHSTSVNQTPTNVPTATTPNNEDNKARILLKTLLNFVAGKDGAFTVDFELNNNGKGIAKKYISPLKTEGKIKNGKISLLTFDEVLTIFNAIGNDFKETPQFTELYEKLASAGLGFHETIDDADSEF